MDRTVGTLEVITGSMFSGKSEELIRRLRRASYAKQKIVVFSPSIDNRYGEDGIYSHDKSNFKAHSVNTIEDMERIMEHIPDVEVIGIDEIQFLPKGVVEFCKKYVELGKRVVVAGLDQDYRTLPFEPLPELMAIADEVYKLKAICVVCGKPSYASQRLINGEPAYDDDPIIAVGSSEKYEARCRMHHIVRKRNDITDNIQILIKLDEVELPDKLKDYHTLTLDINKRVIELRDEIFTNRLKYKKIALIIEDNISKKIEGNYGIIDLMKELLKISDINILVGKNKDMTYTIDLIHELLSLSSLKLKNIY